MDILVIAVFSIVVFLVKHRSKFHLRTETSGIAILAMLVNASALASSITFDLRGSEAAFVLDGVHSGVLQESDLSASFVAGPDLFNEDIFNQTSTRFGINTIDSSADSASLIDAADGISEKLAISFNVAVKIEQIVLSLFASGETASLFFNDRPLILLSGLPAAEDSYNFPDLRLAASEPIVLAHHSGNGFSFDRIIVRSIPVSEPGMLLLMLIGICCLKKFRYRKSR